MSLWIHATNLTSHLFVYNVCIHAIIIIIQVLCIICKSYNLIDDVPTTTVIDTGMGEDSGTLNLKLITNIIVCKSYNIINLDDDPTTLSNVTDTGMREGSGTLNLILL